MSPKISIIICTRNRGDSIVVTLKSVLANTYRQFEVLIIDQSVNDETESAIKSFLDDPRIVYRRTDTSGLSIARNIGLNEAKGEILAFTDDDCTVAPNWLEAISNVFSNHERVAVLFCHVAPAPYNPNEGYIVSYKISRNRILRSMRDLYSGLGIGAGMAARRSVLLSIGGFDNFLGVGSQFAAGEDHDIAIRVIIKKWQVYELADTSVIHYGFRNWQEGKKHAKNNWYGGGGAYIKAIKCGHWGATSMLFGQPILNGLWEPFSDIFHFKKPRGLKRIFHLLQGMILGLKMPVDCEKIIYIEKPSKPSLKAFIV